MKHLKIEQSTSSIEVVDPKVIDKLYNLVLFHPVGESLDSTSNLKGNLLCSHAYGDIVDYLTTNYKDLSISVTGGIYIRFEDKNVETICATNFGDGTGITTVQASVVTDMSDKFANNTSITTFNELKLFTNLKMNNNSTNFNNCTALTSIDLSNITRVGTVGNYYPYVFKGCTNLLNVIFSQNTEYIGTYAFLNCTKFDITIPTSVKYLGCSAFLNCNYSKDVNLPNLTDVTTAVTNVSLADIDGFLLQGWFSNTKIINITNLGSITKLSSTNNDGFATGTFLNCKSLLSATLPTTLIAIGSNLFRDCSALTTVTGLLNVLYIREYAFANCTSLTSVALSNKCTNIGIAAFIGCTNLTSIGDVSTVTTINDKTFNQCNNITSLNLTSACTSISGSAFYQCNNLTTLGDTSNVILGSSGGFMFESCSKLTSIVFKSTTITEDTDYMFKNCSNLTSITGDFTGITKFNSNMFQNCSKLYTLTLPPSLITLMDGVFDSCTSLTTITIPKSVISIGNTTFNQCTSLTSLNFEIGGTGNLYLGALFIGNCPLLTTLVLPSNLTTIETDALGYHDVASTIAINATTVPTLNGAIGGSSDTVFYVPDSSLSTYQAATNWSTMSSRIKGMSTYPVGTSIAAYTFNNWTGLTSIDLTSNITNIGDHAFYNSGLLNNPSVGLLQIGWSSPLTVQYYAFANCTSLGGVYFPHLTDLGANAFKGCISLEEVNLGDYCTSIGTSCFEDCTALDWISCGNGTPPTLGDNIFMNAKSTFKIYVPDASVDTYKAASGWSTYSDKIFSYTQLNIDFPGTRA